MQLHFSEREAWRAWLDEHHEAEREVWLIFYKAHTGISSICYEAAVEEALCFGWIDSIIKRLDEDRYLRKFTPRANTGHWSAINLKRTRHLIKNGRMTRAGLAKLQSGVQPSVPLTKRFLAVPVFLKRALAGNVKARENFTRLAPSYRRHFVAWVASAKKEETRKRRLREAIVLLEKNKKLGLR